MSSNGNGRIFQINLSRGGVPKHAISSVDITPLGIDGDKHHDKRYHGGPDRAVCIYSLEHILALQNEGHPIFPGSTGENLLTIGIDLATVAPGARLAVGDEVELEIASYTAPCKTIGASFIEENFSRISQKVHPGWSRLYARVLRAGSVRVGDPVRRIT